MQFPMLILHIISFTIWAYLVLREVSLDLLESRGTCTKVASWDRTSMRKINDIDVQYIDVASSGKTRMSPALHSLHHKGYRQHSKGCYWRSYDWAWYHRRMVTWTHWSLRPYTARVLVDEVASATQLQLVLDICELDNAWHLHDFLRLGFWIKSKIEFMDVFNENSPLALEPRSSLAKQWPVR